MRRLLFKTDSENYTKLTISEIISDDYLITFIKFENRVTLLPAYFSLPNFQGPDRLTVDSADADHQSGDVDPPFLGGLLEPSLWPIV